MLWFYTRGSETLQAETRVDQTTGEYLLVIRSPDGCEETERYGDLASFDERLRNLQQELNAARWRQAGPPEWMPEGWPRGPGDDSIH